MSFGLIRNVDPQLLYGEVVGLTTLALWDPAPPLLELRGCSGLVGGRMAVKDWAIKISRNKDGATLVGINVQQKTWGHKCPTEEYKNYNTST